MFFVRTYCTVFDGVVYVVYWFFFFKQKTAYEMRISDWSSDVCSSDLLRDRRTWWAALGSIGIRPCSGALLVLVLGESIGLRWLAEIGRASCRERGCQYV